MGSVFLTAIVVFFAMNMGASGIAPSFAAPCGSRIITRARATLLFGVFVVLGACLLGRGVSTTLGKGLLLQGVLSRDVTLVILAAASVSLALANFFKIPQSTSQVTVGAIVGAGLYAGGVSWKMLCVRVLPLWVILPLLSYAITHGLYAKVYPPRRGTLRLFEKVFRHERSLRRVSFVVACYVAFAIGSNNVANAVGPLYGAGVLGITQGLWVIAPLFGVGAWFFGRGPLETAGKEIVPLGVFSTTLVSFVTATLLLVASFLGVPQSLVQLNICSIFAVSSLKNGHRATFDLRTTRKALAVWTLTPLISVVLAYALLAAGHAFFR